MARVTGARLTLLLLLAACAHHEERYVTDWLKVDIVRGPGRRSGGMIDLGPNKEVFRALVGDDWKRVGTGHTSAYMALANGDAALIDLNDGKGAQLLYRGEHVPRPFQEIFGRTGDFMVVPDRVAIDFYDCRVRAEPTGCRDLQIHRHDLRGHLLQTFHVVLPATYPECQLLMARGFDRAGRPYVFAQCAPTSERVKCLLLAPLEDGLFVHAVGKDRPWKDCSDFPDLGVSLRVLEHD